MRSRGSSVGIAMGYWLHGRGIGVPFLARARQYFCSSQRPYRLCGPVSLKSKEYRNYSSSGKAAEAWSCPLHLIPSYTSTFPYIFMAWWLINWLQAYVPNRITKQYFLFANSWRLVPLHVLWIRFNFGNVSRHALKGLYLSEILNYKELRWEDSRIPTLVNMPQSFRMEKLVEIINY
jgi:hypothetical protein